jgi:hypothetical protein
MKEKIKFSRIEEARRLVEENRVRLVGLDEGEFWGLVKSREDNDERAVYYDSKNGIVLCSCPWNNIRRGFCKHILAFLIFLEENGYIDLSEKLLEVAEYVDDSNV